jgi:homoserine/homoserine lactone efflux protein
MSYSILSVYIAIVALNVVIPGPAVMLAISNSMRYGVRKVLISSAGNVSGLFLLSAAAMVGLGTLLATSAAFFAALKIVGAGYLIFLGLRQWWGSSSAAAAAADGIDSVATTRQMFTRGLLVAITNPKPILFFTALFPQFIQPEQPLVPQFFMLTVLFMAISYGGLMGYALAARYARRWLASESGMTVFNRVAGMLFVALGIGLLLVERRR